MPKTPPAPAAATRKPPAADLARDVAKADRKSQRHADKAALREDIARPYKDTGAL